MRITTTVVAFVAMLLVASCSSNDQSSSNPPTSKVAGRGATTGRIGEPIERMDGAYKITLESIVNPGICDTYGAASSPIDTGDELLVATFALETAAIPLTGTYLATADFYTVTGQTVRAMPIIEGQYGCAGDTDGQTQADNPLSNTRSSHIKIFRVPVEANLLGYRDPYTRQAFEWDVTGIAPAPYRGPEIAPIPSTDQLPIEPQEVEVMVPPPATEQTYTPQPVPEPEVTPPADAITPDFDNCVEGTTMYSENAGITYTCRDGSFREGPYN
ncbi:hypothetical protein HQ314_06255 [Rhodococcus sp. BP-332]|uniref:hypothetical protein n=1 Tax=Rhodococcus sp. BP-332 TaxID=2739447 RepID=UPI001C9B103D|nr:hypothetical protein [Rhodococcus sp. BP-332]MBY6676512.1 hypothetical protein [Rhodococcus sp. BP-332]